MESSDFQIVLNNPIERGVLFTISDASESLSLQILCEFFMASILVFDGKKLHETLVSPTNGRATEKMA